MKRIKAVTVEFDDGTRVGYENSPEAENQSFKVGDLVQCRAGRNTPTNLMRCVGVIRVMKDVTAGVEWAGFTLGHNLDGMTRRNNNAGWYINYTDLEYA